MTTYPDWRTMIQTEHARRRAAVAAGEPSPAARYPTWDERVRRTAAAAADRAYRARKRAEHDGLFVRALSFALGDLREWPVVCGTCGDREVVHEPVSQSLWCSSCGARTTNERAQRERVQRAQRELGLAPGRDAVTGRSR